jgi:hypothetical protein
VPRRAHRRRRRLTPASREARELPDRRHLRSRTPLGRCWIARRYRCGVRSAVVDGPPDALVVGTGTLPAAGHAVPGVVALHHVAGPVLEVGDAVEVGADVRRRIGDAPAAPAEVVAVRVGRRSAQRRCGRGSRWPSGRRRPLRRRDHRGRRGRSGRRWPRRRRWGRGCRRDGGGSRRRGRGGARRGCRQRSRVGGWSRWPGDQPHQDEQRHQRQSRRHRGDDLLPAVPGAARAGLRRRWRAPLRRRSWRLALLWPRFGRPPGLRWRRRSCRWWLGRWLVGLLRSPAVRVHPSVGHGRPTFDANRARTLLQASRTVGSLRPSVGRGGSVVTSGAGHSVGHSPCCNAAGQDTTRWTSSPT